MSKKRVVIISDLHCGHLFGLTPPDYWLNQDDGGGLRRVKKFQRELWGFYESQIKALQPIDLLIVNGDAIEGKGWRSGGMELITADRNEQIIMAKKCIEIAKPKAVRVILGTPYHTGSEEHFERMLVEILEIEDKKFDIHGFYNINGWKLDVKHKVAPSYVPHGRTTSIARARLWNAIWHTEGQRQPLADIVIRSHVHYFAFAGWGSWLGVVTPALTYNSIYGRRDCEGVVDVGFVYFDISREGYTWQPILAKFRELKVRPELF